MDALTGSTYRAAGGAGLICRIRAATLMLQAARLRHMLEARRFRSDQPRVPAGYRFGGRWVGEDDGYGPPAGGDRAPSRPVLPASHDDDELPPIPKERPTSGRERHGVARDIARYLIRETNVPLKLAILAMHVAWLADEAARDIIAYQDEPKSLEELRDAVREPKRGYDVHHIVEAGPARREGLPDVWIESRENMVRIPRFKHWEITGWYARPNADFGRLSPRDYLRGKSWEDRMRVGIEALVRHGVLEP